MKPLPNGIRQASIMRIGLPLLCCEDARMEPLSPPNLRFLELIRRKNPGNFLIIGTASYRKESPVAPSRDSRMALCDEMKEKLKREASIWSASFLSEPRGWGTRSEVREFFAIIRELGITPNTHPELEIVVCSNAGHLPRVKMHVNTYNTEHWPVEYRKANHSFEWDEALWEIKTLFVEVLEDIWSNMTRRWRKHVESRKPVQVRTTEAV